MPRQCPLRPAGLSLQVSASFPPEGSLGQLFGDGIDGSWRGHVMDRCPWSRGPVVTAATIWHTIRAGWQRPLHPVVRREGMSRAGVVQAYSQGSAYPPREAIMPGVEGNLASTPTTHAFSMGLATIRPVSAKSVLCHPAFVYVCMGVVCVW